MISFLESKAGNSDTSSYLNSGPTESFSKVMADQASNYHNMPIEILVSVQPFFAPFCAASKTLGFDNVLKY
jgi:hypothetical protein